MGKKWMGAAFAAACFLTLCGFDREMSVEEVYEKSQQAVQEQESVTIDVRSDERFSLTTSSASSGTSTFSAGTSFEGQLLLTKSPAAAALNGELAFGVIGVEMHADISMYVLEKDAGSFDAYILVASGEETSGWQHTVMTAEQLQAVFEQAPVQQQMKELMTPDRMGQTVRRIGGRDCYQLLRRLTYDDVRPFLYDALQAAAEQDPSSAPGQEEMQIIDMAMSGIVWNVEQDVDAETFLPLRVVTDTKGSDLSGLSAFLTMLLEQNAEIFGDITLPELKVSIDRSENELAYDYTSPVAVTLPEEALQAQEFSMEDGEDLLEELPGAEVVTPGRSL